MDGLCEVYDKEKKAQCRKPAEFIAESRSEYCLTRISDDTIISESETNYDSNMVDLCKEHAAEFLEKNSGNNLDELLEELDEEKTEGEN